MTSQDKSRIDNKTRHQLRRHVKQETRKLWRRHMAQIKRQSFPERLRLAWHIVWGR